MKNRAKQLLFVCDEKLKIFIALTANRIVAAPGPLKEEILYIALFF